MAGIRIRHPTAKGGLFLVRHYRKYRFPRYCDRCKVFETHKTYHLDLDSEGCTIVSETVLRRLQEVQLAGFGIMNTVNKPPPITLNIPGTIHNRFKVFEMSSSGEGNG